MFDNNAGRPPGFFQPPFGESKLHRDVVRPIVMASRIPENRRSLPNRMGWIAQTVIHFIGLIAAWSWAFVTIVGGAGLIITLGPWPSTNGWFALFSGLAACPLTTWLLKRYAGLNYPGWAGLAAAVLIIAAGRLTLKIEGRGNFLPGAAHSTSANVRVTN